MIFFIFHEASLILVSNVPKNMYSIKMSFFI